MYKKKGLEDQTRQEGKRKKSITRSKERAIPNPRSISSFFWKSRLKYQEKLEQYLKNQEE